MSYMEPTGNLQPDQNALALEYFRGESKYEIVSIVAYLIGVPQNIFEDENQPPKLEKFQELQGNKNARIIRNLCLLRNQFEQNYKQINDAIHFDYKSIMSLPEYISNQAIMQLTNDGIRIYKSKCTAIQYIMDINTMIADRINNCKFIFPTWINWDYLRDLFLMPNGKTEAGAKAAAALYYENRGMYPYSVYMNWTPSANGNILYNDSKFVKLLYEWNEDEFNDNSKVSDVSEFTKQNIYDFIDDAQRLAFVVDCENSDPYNLCAALMSLTEAETAKVSKIILYDDVHTTSAWKLLEEQIDIPVEHITVERVKDDKSLVDMRLAVGTCRLFYEDNVDSFVLASSDSDYWALISELPRAKFLVMVEHEKCGPDIKEALMSSGIFYCYIDDFYSGNEGSGMKETALMHEMQDYLQEHVQLNLNEMLKSSLHSARIDMDPAQRKQIYDKYLRNIRMSIDEDGNVVMELKNIVL